MESVEKPQESKSINLNQAQSVGNQVKEKIKSSKDVSKIFERSKLSL